MRFDAVDAYLAALSRELRARGVATLRMIEEARGHLLDAVERGIEGGLDEQSAQREAIEQFGRAELVAANFVAETYGMFDRLVLLAGAIMGMAIAYTDSRPTWDDAGITAIALAIASAMCGFATPRRPWRIALAVGIWIAVFSILRSASVDSVAMLVVVAFTLAGAYAGAVMRITLAQRSPRVYGYHTLHDTAVVTPEVAAVMADPDTRLVPFLTPLAPAAFGSLGKAQGITRLDDPIAGSKVRKFEVVFGEDQKVICRMEIGRDGKRVSVHWSRVDN